MNIMLSGKAYMPTRAHTVDAGIDLYAPKGTHTVIYAGGSETFDTGVSVQIPGGVVRYHSIKKRIEYEIRHCLLWIDRQRIHRNDSRQTVQSRNGSVFRGWRHENISACGGSVYDRRSCFGGFTSRFGARKQRLRLNRSMKLHSLRKSIQLEDKNK